MFSELCIVRQRHTSVDYSLAFEIARNIPHKVSQLYLTCQANFELGIALGTVNPAGLRLLLRG